MKFFNILSLFIILILGTCNALTCDEAKSLLNIEYDGNCCDLQQINCDEYNENILSMYVFNIYITYYLLYIFLTMNSINYN